MWYIVALAEERQGLRIFRLDRVNGIEVLDEHFDVPPDFSVDELLKSGRLFNTSEAAKITVRYSPAIARWIAERERVAPEDIRNAARTS
jgi:predicted DNA-binding transcriptional regulator YafY